MKIRSKREDYKEIEGKKFDYVYESGIVVKAILIGCNRSVGITAVKEGDPSHKLICVNGPVTKKYNAMDETAYNHAFDLVVGKIISGSYEVGGLHKILTGHNGEGNNLSCPYGG